MGMKMRSCCAVVMCLTFLVGCLGGETLQLNDDVLGLIVLKSGLEDPSKSLDSWNEDDESPCAWKFIKCNPGNSRVSEVSLDGLGLSGKIGRGLEKLQSLKVLSLSNNNLTGSINPELALIPNLERLNLSLNSLSGNIPSSLSNVSSLQFLDLSQNSLSGPLPDNMFQTCFSLRYLSLAGNRLEGPIPSTLPRCTTLNHLNLSSNHFSGNPNFSGGIWSLTRLRTLDLSNNVLTGSVPQLSYWRFPSMDWSNEQPGIPGFLKQWPDGISPTSMGDLKSLKFLSLSNNKLSGAIPSSIAEISSLSVVRLRGNTFNGSIPEGLFDVKLDEVDLSRNELTGSIPPASSKLSETLQMLDLSGNKITGDIPAEMGLFSKLRYLNLSWNNLESRMPPELGFFQNLTVLDLRSSGLIGSIPGDICDSGSLAILQLDGNSLTGPIPEEIGNCSSLYLLSLSHNNLSGPIPESMSLLSKLKILKLEANQLSGEIPQELGRLGNLLIVNISYNRLVGRLPAGGIFQTLDASAIEGNLGICSQLLKGPCKLNVPKPLVLDPYAYGNQMGGQNRGNERSRSSTNFRHHRFLSVSAIVAISAAAVIAVGVVVISLLNASARRRISFVDNALESMCSSSTRSANVAAGKLILFDSKSSPDWLSASFDSVLNKAAEIGEGVFGTVYKASLGGQGTTVAIKKLITANTLQYQEEFDREVRILGKARHPNLIPLRASCIRLCSRRKLTSKTTRAVSFLPPLTWPNRFKIVLGTAKGLAHLHHSCRPPIVHYNIKPSNILLDENLNPKISDFGLTRLLTKLDKHVVSNRFQSAPGYVAPELACQSLRVNEKCDVYGFGVLILELVTGRRPVEYGEDNVIILSDHVRVLLEQGNVLDCVDLSMGKYPEEEVLPVLKLALVCTSQIPSSRPSMAEVVQILQVIKTPIPNRMEAF
ncbi:UNVERIFIED_CONTAM: putative inactive leucine-rich repeat receptor-like protein kinase [Sesamum angustifolium]|uniref:non-specific serine/threonine protein kinase n=1 Tax=Sesamum angustifolium TaxID=2727405 RepID=A0AAW2LY58_9LAMI